MKALLPSFVLPYIGTLCDSPFKRYKRLTKAIFMWNMWEGFHSSFKPAQVFGHQCGEQTLNWTQLVSIVAPVWSKQLGWKVMRCCTLEKSLSNAIFLENVSIQPASYIVIFLLRFYVLSRRNDLSTLGEKNCNQCDYLFSEVGNLRMHLMKNTVEKSRTIATGIVMHFLNQTIWGHFW